MIRLVFFTSVLLLSAPCYTSAQTADVPSSENGSDTSIELVDPSALEEDKVRVDSNLKKVGLPASATRKKGETPSIPKLVNVSHDEKTLLALKKDESEKSRKLISEATGYIQGIRLQEGLQNLLEAERIAGELFVIHNLRGAAYTKMRDFVNARASFSAAIKLAPGNFVSKFNLAEIEYVEANYDQAEKSLTELITLQKDEWTALENNRNSKKITEDVYLATKYRLRSTMRLIQLKILICHLKRDQLAKADKIMAEFGYLDETPAYYSAKAAYAFHADDKEEASTWLETIKRVYASNTTQIFFDALLKAGWLDSI